MLNRLNSAAAVLCFGWLAVSNSSFGAELDDLILRSFEETGTTGGAVVVLKGGAIDHIGHYGLASVELQAQVTPETVFQIASSTKAFGGVAIMMLVEDGALTLDQPIGEILTDLPERWRNVTVRHIMTHTSGLPDLWAGPGQMVGDTPDAILEALRDRETMFEPGARWRYNQAGYLLAGLIIQKLTGMTFAEFCEARIFEPLGMSSAEFGGVGTLVPNRASTYGPDSQGRPRPFLDGTYELAGIAPAAGLNLTAADLAKFVGALSRGELLTSESIVEMWRPVTLNDGTEFRYKDETVGYGIGWSSTHYTSGHVGFGHDGGMTNAFEHFPEDDLTVIVLTNWVNPNGPPMELLERLGRHYIPDLRSFPSAVAAFRELIDNEPESTATVQTARQLIMEQWSNKNALTTLLLMLAERDRLHEGIAAVALDASIQLLELTADDPMIAFYVKAWSHYYLGDFEAAIMCARQSFDEATSDGARNEIQQVIRRFEEAAGADKVSKRE
jgi:CubicO group peptidase (beta-lactamase class C family)